MTFGQIFIKVESIIKFAKEIIQISRNRWNILCNIMATKGKREFYHRKYRCRKIKNTLGLFERR